MSIRKRQPIGIRGRIETCIRVHNILMNTLWVVLQMQVKMFIDILTVIPKRLLHTISPCYGPQRLT
jgi:hypothetical protein